MDFVEQFNGDGIIPTLRKVNTTLEIATAQMQSANHIRRMTRETVIVQFNVRIKHILRANPDFLHPLNHRDSAKVREERIIDLNVSAAAFVQVGDFLAVRLCDVGKIALFTGIGFLGEGVVAVTEMEPFGCALGSDELSRGGTMVTLMYLTSSAGTRVLRNSKAGP
jgi:hypothetical protein